MTALRWGSATDTGLVRRNNQDNLLVGETLFAVADGMGGHVGGEVASKAAVDALQQSFGDHRDGPPTADDLLAAVHDANLAVYQRSQDDAGLRGMGTTLTAAALVSEDGDERIAIANVGDSRAYVFTQGDLTQLTEDHSVAEELARQGQIEPDEVDTHPQRHILTRAMGILPDVDVDLWEVLPYAGDRLLLCSDGLVREVTDDQIAAVLRRLGDPGQAAQELVAKARANGGSDNITVVVIDVVDDEGRSSAASDALAGDPPPPPENMADAPPATFPKPGPEAPEAVATPPRRRRVTVRSVLFVLLVLAILAGAAVAVVAYARDTYFVALGPPGSGPPSLLESPGARPLVIFQGRPGGLLWFHPTLADRTGVLSTQVLPARLPDLAKGQVEPSLGAARTYVANLLQEAARSAAANPAFTTPAAKTTTTTTTVPVVP